MDWKEITWWVCVFLGASPVVAAIIWHAWEFHILPRRIPLEEVERLADEITRKHPDDPDYWAYVEEYNAWHRSETFEQGKWRRVREYIVKIQIRKGRKFPRAKRL